MSNAPLSHVEDALQLTGDHRVDLWQIQLRNNGAIYRFWNGKTSVWQGQTWDGLACNIGAESRSSDGQRSRPALTVINPDNLFGQMAADGLFDLATLTRKRVLQTHFQGDVNIFQQSIYITTRVMGLSDQGLQLELRYPTDMPPYKTPRRTYSPPQYPFVVI